MGAAASGPTLPSWSLKIHPKKIPVMPQEDHRDGKLGNVHPVETSELFQELQGSWRRIFPRELDRQEKREWEIWLDFGKDLRVARFWPGLFQGFAIPGCVRGGAGQVWQEFGLPWNEMNL